MGLVEKIEAEAPLPEAKSVASQTPLARVMVTVRLGGGGPRTITTVTVPSALGVEDKVGGAGRPFWLPVM